MTAATASVDHRVPLAVAAVGSAALGALLWAATLVPGMLRYVPGDVFALQTGGSAFLAFALGLAMEARIGHHPNWILVAAAFAAALGTAIGAAVGLLGPTGGRLGLSTLVGGAGLAAILGYLLLSSRRLDRAVTGPQISRWFTYLLVWGCIASALFGFGGLILGGTFGKLFGFAGVYDLLYRMDGGVTLGILVGSILAVRSRVWPEIRTVVVVGLVTNVLTLVGAVADIYGAGAAPGQVLILAAAMFNVGGLGLGLAREGR